MVRWGLLALPAVAALSGCTGEQQVLAVNDAYMRLSPVEANPAALYFTISGGPEAVVLQAVQIANAQRTELHETVKDPATGAMRMQPVRDIPVPAGGSVELKPGGTHVMVYGVNTVARRMGATRTIFVFSNGDRIQLDVPLRMAGAGQEHHP